jgi:hypothetical protein
MIEVGGYKIWAAKTTYGEATELFSEAPGYFVTGSFRRGSFRPGSFRRVP